jgi:hypothetical protein
MLQSAMAFFLFLNLRRYGRNLTWREAPFSDTWIGIMFSALGMQDMLNAM